MGQLLGRQKPKGLCAICLEKMYRTNISALRCGHLFHFQCIKYWLTEQETCPECRQPSSSDDIVTRLYFHDDIGDRKSECTNASFNNSCNSDDSNSLDSCSSIVQKFEVACIELASEKKSHEQTKKFLNMIQNENFELIKVIETLVKKN